MKKTYTLLFIFFLSFLSFNAAAQTGLVINEFDYDQPGPDSAEFIELYNSSANAIDLGQYSILFINGNNNNVVPYDTIVLPTHSLSPGAFFVICGSLNVVPLCDLFLSVPDNIIQNGSPDALAIIETTTGNVIDAVSYEGTVSATYFETAGVPPVTNSDSGLVHYQGLSRYPDGNDSNDNSADFHLYCVTPGAANVNSLATCMTSVSDLSASSSLKIYPNPSKGNITIDLKNISAASGISVKNVIGKEIRNVVLTGTESLYQLDLSEFSDGIYFLSVKTNTGEKTQRILLRK